MKEEIFKDMQIKMEKTVEKFRYELGKIRTGRASISIVEDMKIDYYGTSTPLNQVASLSVPESNIITVQPWDVSCLPIIERAIMSSDLGLTPTNDGKIIRIVIPLLTEERRKELVKVTKKIAEESKIAIRNSRRDANDLLKAFEKEKGISQDELKKAQVQVQDKTNAYVSKVDEVLEHKEHEIMEI